MSLDAKFYMDYFVAKHFNHKVYSFTKKNLQFLQVFQNLKGYIYFLTKWIQLKKKLSFDVKFNVDYLIGNHLNHKFDSFTKS